MARALYIPKSHIVLATERAPAGFRPGNQAILERTSATNPIYAHTDSGAFMPGMGECRSGNGSSDLGLGRKWLDHGQTTVSGLGESMSQRMAQDAANRAAFAARPDIVARNAMQAKSAEIARRSALAAARNAAAKAAQASTEYQDASGNVISADEYAKLMFPTTAETPQAPVQQAPVYKDSTGAVITKAQYDALVRAASQAAQQAAVVPRQKPPVVVTKRLPKKPLNGLGALSDFPKPLVLVMAASAAYLAYKHLLKKSR